jgi:hypothetical protein
VLLTQAFAFAFGGEGGPLLHALLALDAGGFENLLLVAQEPLVFALAILLDHRDLRLGKLSRIDSIPHLQGLSTIHGNMLSDQMMRPFLSCRRVDG